MGNIVNKSLHTRILNLLIVVVIAATGVIGFAAPQPIQAQAPAQSNGLAPVIMTYKGDLWSWDGAQVKSRTTWGYNSAPVLAPGGGRIAYNSIAKIAVDMIASKSYPGVGGALPSNIWLLDVATNDAIRIADQPANASLFTLNVPDTYIFRSDPAWSPDGSSIAWTEGIVTAGSQPVYRLMVYDVASNTSKTLVNNLPAPSAYEGFLPLPVVWGEPGLAIMQEYVEMPKTGGTVYVYNTAGQLLSTSPQIPNLAHIVWMIDGAQVMVGLIAPLEGAANSLQWQLYNPLGGAPIPLSGSPELFSITAPGGLSLSPVTPNASSAWKIANAPALVNEFPNTQDYFGFLTNLAISPDGLSYAYADGQNIYTGGPGGLKTIVPGQNAIGVLWGPVRWRVKH